jgi:hypothetical protein
MKIKADYDPASGIVNLNYDLKAQRIFENAAKKLTPLFDFHSTPLRRMMGEESEEDVVKPLKLLSDLGSSPTRRFQVRPPAVQFLLNLICWHVLGLSDSQTSVKPFDDAVKLLSQVTPFPILPVDLPPVNEVFDKQKVPPAVWKSFEQLRNWDRHTFPHLTAVEIVFLLQELKKLRRPMETLKSLAASLDAAIYLIRATFEVLAIQEISGTSLKKRKR